MGADWRQQQEQEEEEIYYSHILQIILAAAGIVPDFIEIHRGLLRELDNVREQQRVIFSATPPF